MNKGETFVVTSGDEEHRICGALVALKDFDFDATLQTYIKAERREVDAIGRVFDAEDFVVFLEQNGFVAESPLLFIHLAEDNQDSEPEKAARTAAALSADDA